MLDEFEDLIFKAQNECRGTIRVTRCHSGMWEIFASSTDEGTFHAMTRDEVITKLRELATPKPPDMITLPPISTRYLKTVRSFIETGKFYQLDNTGELYRAITLALAPYDAQE